LGHRLLPRIITLFLLVVPGHAAALLAPPTSHPVSLVLLRAGRFQELDTQLSGIQRGYKQGLITEEHLADVFRMFYDTDPGLEPKYNEWIKQLPRSYVARLARGIYYRRRGVERHREAEANKRFSDDKFQITKEVFSKAERDLRASLLLDDRPLLSYYHLLDASAYQRHHEETRRLLDLATQVAPSTFIVRDKFIDTLRVRWGGSVSQMYLFLNECRRANLSDTDQQALEAIVLDEQGWVDENINHDFTAAERDYRKAVELGRADCAPCGALGNVLVHQKEYPEATEVFSMILSSDPENISVVASRAFAYNQLGKLKEAVADWKVGAAAGDAYSQSELGRMFMIGVPGVLKPDFDTGLKLFRESAAQGYQAGRQNLERALALRPAAQK
jgi:tetratricopeptide (TPR) repeat protein